MNSPLTSEHTAQLAAAMTRATKIRRATKMATVNGWVLGISAAMTAPFAPFSLVAFLLLVALGILSWNEFRGRKLLEAFAEAGAELLWKNQLGLMVVVVAYCGWGIRVALAAPAIAGLAELEEFLPDLGQLMKDLTTAVFVVIIAVTIVLQAGLARFYHDRIALVRDYLSETPAWTAEVVRIVQGGSQLSATASRPTPDA